MKLKFYVVNLKRAADRRQLMSEQLDKYGVDYEIFEATDGRALSAEDEQKLALSDHVILTMAGGRQCMVEDKMCPPEVGCALSHLRLYQHILDQGVERAVILEDDVVLNDDSLLALNNLDVIDEPWDVVHFSEDLGIKNLPEFLRRKYYIDRARGLYFARLGMHNETLDAIFNRRRLVLRTAFYVVTPQACQTLLKLGYPVRINADYLLGSIAYNHLKMFLGYPVGHYLVPNEADKQSSIGSDRPKHRLVRL